MIKDFWRLTFRRWRAIARWDLAASAVFGFATAAVPGDQQIRQRFEVLLSTEAAIAAGLLGLVLAALALLVAFLNEDLIAFLDSQGEGLAEDIWPFSFSAVLAALTALTALWFLAVGSNTDVRWMRIGIGCSTGLLAWTLSAVLALVRVVHSYGRVRATLAAKSVAGVGTPPLVATSAVPPEPSSETPSPSSRAQS